MPSDKPPPPHERVLLPIELAREAADLAADIEMTAQIMAQTLIRWARPEWPIPLDKLVEGPPEGATADQLRAEAELVLVVLRRAMAVLQSPTPDGPRGDEIALNDERQLVDIVVRAAELARLPPATEEECKAWLAGNEWLHPRRPPRTPVEAVAYTFTTRGGLLSLPVAKTLWDPINRAHIVEAVAILTGHAGPRGKAKSKAPRWLEPLYLAAKAAGLTVANDAKGWAMTLENHGISLPKKAAP